MSYLHDLVFNQAFRCGIPKLRVVIFITWCFSSSAVMLLEDGKLNINLQSSKEVVKRLKQIVEKLQRKLLYGDRNKAKIVKMGLSMSAKMDVQRGGGG